uniref:Uncharacterized protein n=1 Tax=Rhizophora mucronata TaxID=61149 RepID=A0A2P2N7Y8_RHIMU
MMLGYNTRKGFPEKSYYYPSETRADITK